MRKVKLPPLSVHELNTFTEFLSRCSRSTQGGHAERVVSGLLAVLYQQMVGKSIFPKKETKISVPVYVGHAIVLAYKNGYHHAGSTEHAFDILLPNIISHIDKQL